LASAGNAIQTTVQTWANSAMKSPALLTETAVRTTAQPGLQAGLQYAALKTPVMMAQPV